MKSTHRILFLFIIFSISLHASPIDSIKNIDSELNEEEFFDKIPFNNLTETFHPINLEKYETLDRLMIELGRDRGLFCILFSEALTVKYPTESLSLKEINKRYELAESFLRIKQKEYEISADIILSDITDGINKGVQTKKYSKKDKTIHKIIESLEGAKYNVIIPVSNLEKFWHHFFSGNWGYILDRLRLDYPFVYYSIIFILPISSFLLAFFLYRKVKKGITKPKQK